MGIKMKQFFRCNVRSKTTSPNQHILTPWCCIENVLCIFSFFGTFCINSCNHNAISKTHAFAEVCPYVPLISSKWPDSDDPIPGVTREFFCPNNYCFLWHAQSYHHTLTSIGSFKFYVVKVFVLEVSMRKRKTANSSIKLSTLDHIWKSTLICLQTTSYHPRGRRCVVHHNELRDVENKTSMFSSYIYAN